MQVMAAAQGRPASAAIAPAARMSAARGGGKHDALRRGIAAHAGAYLALRARRRPVEPVHRAADGVRRLEYPAGRPAPARRAPRLPQRCRLHRVQKDQIRLPCAC